MNKVAHYLQEHVSGEVVASADVRRHFATDNSIFTMMPALVVYPRSEQDVRKVARFTWQLAERDRILPITARGGGSDQSGAAIGSGMIMAFPAHMNRIVELDTKSGMVVVEPGIAYATLQQALKTHGRFLPPCPASAAYATVGGGVANNAGGMHSVKYGGTRAYTHSLRMVLANGEVITTERLQKRELSKKLGLTTFEGEIYRSLDALLDEHKAVIDAAERQVMKNAAGYDLLDIKQSDGSFDLTPLIVGSQGTLGIVTEITLETEVHNQETTLIAAYFDDAQQLQSGVLGLKQARELPSAMELIDGSLLAMVAATAPARLKGLERPYPKFILLVEYDDPDRVQRRNARKGAKLLERYATQVSMTDEPAEQAAIWRLRDLSSAILGHANGNAKALPIIEDGAVPVERLGEFLTGVYDIFQRSHVEAAVWGHAGDGNLHVRPHLDISLTGDRQRAFRLMDEYYKLVISLGGTTTGQHGDGRLRAPYLEQMYGPDVYALFQKVKKIFDPYGTLNPGVKVGTTLDDLKPLLRQEYTLGHLLGHLPRS